MRIAAVAAGAAVVAFALCVLAPLRQLSGDTVPGRIGGAVLRCAGDFDLAHVDWVKSETVHDRVYYYMLRDEIGEHPSVFGPAPAVLVAVALLDFGEGDAITDDALRRRERGAAALLLAIAVALIVIASARIDVRRAGLAGITCALSFAGAASLGQGMWQATTALPVLTGALAALAWRDRFPRVGLTVPALLLLAVMLRPTIAPLVLGIGITWLRDTRSVLDRRGWIVATVVALGVVTPLVVWNAVHLQSPLPIGQWIANTREGHAPFSISGAATGIAGLLVSPARGTLWFAPIVIVAVAYALRHRGYRIVAIACVVQLVAMAAFFKWHGGQAFGPRLLAETTWVAIMLALGTALPIRRALLVPALAITIVVGQLGLWRFTPEQWEFRRKPEAHPGAFWDFADSPLFATFTTPPPEPRAYDSTPNRGLECIGGELRSLR